jgi:hypothetical protein
MNVNTELAEPQKQDLHHLFVEFADCFANGIKKLSTTSLITHKVILKPNTRPYYCTSNKRFAPVELNFIRQELDRLLAARDTHVQSEHQSASKFSRITLHQLQF